MTRIIQYLKWALWRRRQKFKVYYGREGLSYCDGRIIVSFDFVWIDDSVVVNLSNYGARLEDHGPGSSSLADYVANGFSPVRTELSPEDFRLVQSRIEEDARMQCLNLKWESEGDQARRCKQ
jgi:hypothetical protein